MISGLEGTCPLCGSHYYGWALESPYKQSCPRCGSALQIRRDGVLVTTGFPSLNAKVETKKLGLLEG